MSKRPAKGVAPARRAVAPQGSARRSERRNTGRTEGAAERPPPGWSGPFIPYPPLPPPPLSKRILGGVRTYGLVGLAVLIALVGAGWWLVAGEAESGFELSPGEWRQVTGTSAAGGGVTDAPVRLSVVTRPTGAEVRVDFDSVGITPVDQYSLAAGTYLVSVAKDGYMTYDTLLAVASGERSTLQLALQAWGGQDAGPAPAQIRAGRGGASPPTGATREVRGAPPVIARGGLRVTAGPAAAVWLDGQRVGATPLTLEGVAAGAHTVEVRAESGETYVEHVVVEAGATVGVDAAFAAAVGRLTVLVQPWGSIYIDGRLHRQDTDVQYEVELAAGPHRVRVEHPALGSVTREVTVTPGAAQQVVIDLNARAGGS